MAQLGAPYAVRLDVEYQEQHDRLTAALRLIWVIPIGIVLSVIATADSAVVGGLLFIPVLLMIVFRQKYPRWWFDWNLELSRFSVRVVAYLLLLRD